MIGYDHHCTLVNNCIGKRNLRAFVTLLIAACLFYLTTGIIGALIVLYVPYKHAVIDDGGSIDFNYDLVIDIILVLLQLIKFVLLCCMHRCVTFTQSIIWILVEAVLVLGLAISTLDWTDIVAAPLLSVGLSLMLMIWPLMKKHLELVAHHLTEKEFYARMETVNKLQVEDFLIKNISCKQKC